MNLHLVLIDDGESAGRHGVLRSSFHFVGVISGRKFQLSGSRANEVVAPEGQRPSLLRLTGLVFEVNAAGNGLRRFLLHSGEFDLPEAILAHGKTGCNQYDQTESKKPKSPQHYDSSCSDANGPA